MGVTMNAFGWSADQFWCSTPHELYSMFEIRAEEKPFGRGGRINYELDGTVLKAYLP